MKEKLLLFFMCLSLGVTSALAQTTKVTGKVIGEEDKEPVIGASILVKGTTIGTVTDIDGNFSLNIPESAKTLVISYIGMVTQEVAVRSVVNVIMKPESMALDEVMVIAYGTAKKSSFTGSASVVKGEKLNKLQTSNLTKSLEGAIAGVQTVSSSGQPGSSSGIYIRGIGSIAASTAPLLVVDGVPYEGSLSSINNQDVESMTVLKDAAANSMYGARGANGVIMITTKKGRSGKTNISLDAKWGTNNRGVKPYKVIESEGDYYEMYWESLKNEAIYGTMNAQPLQAGIWASQNMIKRLGGYNAFDVPDQALINPVTGLLNPNANLLYHDDWLNDPFRTGFRQEYNMSFSGGSDKTTFYVSFNYLDDNSFMRNSDFKRYSGRVKLDHKLTNWFRAGVNAAYSQTNTNSTASGGVASDMFYFAQYVAPIYPIWQRDAQGNIMKDIDGNDILDYGVGNGKSRPYATNSNPYTAMLQNIMETTIDNFSAKAYGEIVFLKDFKFTANVSLDVFNISDVNFKTPIAGDAANVNGRSSRSMDRNFILNANQLLNWNRDFDKHNIDVLLGHETKADSYSAILAKKSQFMIPTNPELSNGAKVEDATSQKDTYHLEGYFTRVQYNYADRYYLSGSYRTDGSSRFHPDHRWGSFWSVGASWRLKEEYFMQDLMWLSDLKLKASYGTQGNDNLNNFTPYMDQYVIVANPDGSAGLEYYYRGNELITWEKSRNFNAGLEFGFWNGRVTGGVEFFLKETKDLLYGKPVPLSSGKPYGRYVNDMSMRNTGVEGELGVMIINNNDLKWRVDLNMTHYKNKLTALAKGKPAEGYASGSYWRKKGGSMYDWYMYHFEGVDPNTGDALYTDKDLEGNVIGTTATPSTEDQCQLGKSSLPTLYGGLSTVLDYKGFDLSVTTAFSVGGYVIDNSYSSLMGFGSDGSNWSTDMYNRWTPTNRNTNIPRVQTGKQEETSDRFLTRGDYFSLKNITLGYTLPKKLVSKAYIQSLRVYAVGDNLFLGSKRQGLDPRQNISGGTSTSYYSAIRTISLGVSVNF